MKILALILCLCTLFALTSCDMLVDYIEQFMPPEDTGVQNDKDGENSDADGTAGNPDDNAPDSDESPMTSLEWENATDVKNFDNITFTIEVVFPDTDKPYVIVCKIDGDTASYREGSYPETVADEETREAIYSIYINTVLSIVDNFDNFSYDGEKDLFVSAADIVYNVTVMEYDAVITASNTTVKIDKNKNIAEIDCNMKQEYKENGISESLEIDVVFSFTDYGTTVVGDAK